MNTTTNPTTFQVGTRVWPVMRDPKNPKTTWCGKPVTLTRPVTIDRPAINVNATPGAAKKFSRFVELNRDRGHKYAIYLFDLPVARGPHVVLGFVADAPK